MIVEYWKKREGIMKVMNKIRSNFFISGILFFFAVVIFFLSIELLVSLYYLMLSGGWNFYYKKALRTAVSLFIPFFLLDLIYYLGNAKRKGKFDKK
ncbi:hypothetical protein A1D23_13335 [Chelonobacter oris]|nr:hypothetical protein [Chelonobacter oris]